MAKTLWEKYGSGTRAARTVAHYGTVKGKQTGAATVAPKTSEKDQNRGGLLGGIGYAWAKSGLGTIGLVENVVETGLGALSHLSGIEGMIKLFGGESLTEKMQESTWVDYDAADKWYNPSEEWKNIGRAASVDKYLVSKVFEGATQTLEGVDDYITGGLASLVGADDYAKHKFDSDWASYGHADEWFDPEDGWKFAGDVASGIGTSVPAIAANFIPVVGPAVSIAISGFGAAGNATKEAYRETGKLGAAEYGYGALVGGTEALIEGVSNKIGVGTGDLAKTIVGKMGGKTVKSTAKAATQATVGGIAKRIGKDFLSEAAEEGIAEIMDPLYRNLLNEKGEGVTWDVNWGDVGYAALVGGMTGALMGGAAVPIERSSSIKTAESVIANGRLDSVMAAAELVADSERTYQTGYGKFRQTQGLYDQLRSSLDTTGGEVTTKQQKIMLGELTQSLAVATQMPTIEKSATKLLLHAEESASVASEQLAPVAEQMGLVDADGKPMTLTAESIIGDIDMSLYDSRKRSDRKLFAQQVRQAIGTNPILTALAVADAYADVATGTGNADADVDVNEAGSPHTSSAETGGMTSSAPTIEDFARDTGIVAETGEDLTAGVPSGSVSQMGVQKENAAGGVFEGQAAQSENASGVESDEAIEMRRVVEDTGMPQATADAMVETYRPVEGMTAREYAAAFAEAEMYGRRGVSEAALARNEQIAKLPADVARAAYGLGVKAADNTNAGVQKENATAGAGAGVKYALSDALQTLGDYDATRRRHIESSGKDKISRDYNEIMQFIREAPTKKETFERLHIGVVNDATADLVESKTGQNIRNYDVVLTSNFTAHIFEDHGNQRTETPRNQIAVNITNIENIIETVISPDDVRAVQADTGPALRFEKTLDGQNVALMITSTKRGTLTLKSAWIIDNSGGRTPSANAQALAGTSKTNSRSSTNNSIPQSEPGVNKKNTEISRPSLRPGRVLRAEGVNVQKFSDAQYATYKAAEIMARALGTDIVIHESLGKTKDGKVINGYFDPKNGRIHVNINAMRDGSHIGLYVLSHEVTHAIKEWSPRKYAELERFVMERLGADAEVKIEAKLKQMRDAGLISETATEAEAYALAKEEVVAEGMENVLSDGKVLEALAKQNRTLWQKIKDVVTAAIGKIKAAFGDLNKHSKTAQVLTNTVESLESIEQLFYEGVVDAGENRQKNVGKNGMVVENSSVKVGGDTIRYSSMNDLSLEDNVDQIMEMTDEEARRNKEEGNFVSIMKETPSVIVDNVEGAENLEIIMRFDSFYLATRHEGVLEGHYHNYGEIMKKLPEIIADPEAVVRMDNGRLNLFATVARTPNKNSVLSIELNTVKDVNSKNTKYNMVISVMSSKDNYVRNIIEKHGTKVEYRKEGLSQVNHQLYEWLATVNDKPSKHSIDDPEGKVNSFDENSQRKFSVENDTEGVDTNEEAAEEASPSPTDVETEVQNEAVARVEKAEATTEKELKAENAKLREDVEHLKELLKLQRTVTDGTTFTKASMSRAASRIMKVIGATRGKTQLLEQISQLYAEIATAEQVDMEDIMSRAEEIAEELIDEQPGTRAPGDPEYAEILDYLRSTSFSLTDVQKQEAAYRYGSYESFRRRMMGRLKIKKNAASLDVIWGELCELYPGIFSTEMNEADMVEAIVQIRHDAVINQTAFAYIDKDAAISDVARTIYDGYWDAVPVHTLADEHRREVSLLKAKHARVTEEIRASADRRVAAMRESLKEQNRRVREQRDEAVRKERERADARIEGWRERRQETKDRHAVRRATSRLYKRLLSPTKERNVPESLRAAVAEALGAMKLDARVMDQIADIEAEIEKLERQDAPDLKKIETLESKLYKLEENAATLKEQSEAILRAYEAAAKEKDSPLADEIVEKLRELQAEIGESPVGIYDMDRKQLRAARDFYEMILHQVTNANKMLAADRQATVDKNGTAAMIEMSESKAPKFLKPRAGEARSMVTLRKYLWQMLKPINAVEMLGSDTLSHAFANLHRGEGVCSVDLAEAQEKFQAEAETYHFWDWDRASRREFKTANGKTVKLTLGQMMSLYAYSKRENAHQHLREGGFTFAPDATYKGKITERMLQDSERYTLTEAEFGKIASALTEEQRAFADAMQEYLSKDMAAKGNEVSVKLYGIKLFGEENYWPMRSAREYLDSETGKTGDPKIKNKGFTKRVVPDAGNPLVLSDFMETWNGHVGEMALYHGMTLPMEDMNRLLNFKPGGDFDAEGADAGRSTSITKYSSMKELIREKYGYEAVTYIEQLLRDLNGGVRSGVPMDLIDKGISLFKKSSVMASASVVIQQPSSIARAWAMINPKYFANTKGLDFKNSRENYEELKKYAPIAIVKEMGGFDTGVGQATSDYIMEREYKGGEKLGAFFKDKAYRDHVFGYAASKADQMAWLQLWEACKREQAELHPDMAADSDEVMKLAGERFTDIVAHTQVYDSTLSRSAMMRSKDTTWKMATAFMAEPTTVFNMLVMGAVKLQRGDAKAFRGVVGSVIAATFLNAVLASLVYAARDDDEDKSYPEKYVEALVGESIDSFNPLTLLPIVKDIWSLVQGYNVERTDMAVVADLIDAVNKLKIDENTTGEEIAGKWVNLAVSFSSVFGLPLRNLQRDARAIGNVISNKNKSTWSGVGYAARESAVKQIPFGKLFGVGVNVSDGQQLYEAAVTGNDKQYARVTARFESETAARTALRTALRDNDPRIEEAARARLDADTATYARLVREIVAEGYFSQTDVVAAVNSEYNAMVRDIESGAEDNADPDAGDEAIASIYKSADLNAELDAGDWKQAKVIIDDMVAAKIASGKSQKQARAAIKSGVTSYWKPLYLEAYASRNSAELRRIRALLARTRLYGTASEVAETVAGWVKDEAKKKAEAKKIARQGG